MASRITGWPAGRLTPPDFCNPTESRPDLRQVPAREYPIPQSITSEVHVRCPCGQEGLITRVNTIGEESTGIRLPEGFHLESRDGFKYLVCYLCNEPVSYVSSKAFGGIVVISRRRVL